MGFTKKSIAALSLPAGKPYWIVWDEDLPGFGIRLNSTSRVWVVQYRASGKSRRETIGRVDAMPLEMAREQAKKTLARVSLGADPHAERAEADARRATTVGMTVDRYLQAAKVRLKTRSFEEVKRHLSKHWQNLHDMPLQKVDRRLVAARLEEIAADSGPVAANRARAALSALYSYALGTGVADFNPVVGTIKLANEAARDRVLSDSEIAIIWNRAGTGEHGKILRLLLLTGQRRDEVGSMRWSELDLENTMWAIPGERTKNGRPHEVPLSDPAVSILKATPRQLQRDLVFGSGGGGFSGWSKAKWQLDRRIEDWRKVNGPQDVGSDDHTQAVQSWRLHDLRRTCATGMANLGVQPHVVEAVLNHVSGSRAGVAGIYNRAAYRGEKRAGLLLWADHLEKLCNE